MRTNAISVELPSVAYQINKSLCKHVKPDIALSSGCSRVEESLCFRVFLAASEESEIQTAISV